MIGWKAQKNLPAKIYIYYRKKKIEKKLKTFSPSSSLALLRPLHVGILYLFTQRKKKNWRNILPLPQAWRFSPLTWSGNLRRTDLSSLEFVLGWGAISWRRGLFAIWWYENRWFPHVLARVITWWHFGGGVVGISWLYRFRVCRVYESKWEE